MLYLTPFHDTVGELGAAHPPSPLPFGKGEQERLGGEMRYFVPHFTSKTSTPRPSEGRGWGWGGILQQYLSLR